MAQRKPDTRSQRQKFIDAAREHGADGDEETFRRAVRTVAAAKPMPKPKKGSSKRKV